MPGRTTFLRGHELVNVAGESHYQEALGALARPSGDERVDVDTTAHLVPEPENPHDPAAIRVEIEGHKVGYLPRALATDYGALVAPIAARGRTASCEARIAGHTGSFGVFLKLPPPDDPHYLPGPA